MKKLPVGIQSFRKLIETDYLYVDKTAKLQELIESGSWYFLSRPRRFGKSLTLSTLEEMFKGNFNLFKGLKARQWVREQSEHPSPILRLDMSGLGKYSNVEELNFSMIRRLKEIAEDNNLQLSEERTCDELLRQVIRSLHRKYGAVVILIDEYDKPILENLTDLKKANEFREILRSFYTMIKSCDDYLRFVFITGISKFSKIGVFSAMNNLEDISMYKRYGDIVGYTQEELEYFFQDWLTATAADMEITRKDLLARLKNYYDGFSFDGKIRLYNPFSILQCLKKGEFHNYWYESGSPSFIIKWMQEHKIQDPEEYRHIIVNSNDFISVQEIEQADAPSFLYQSGYLTIEKKEDQLLTLDYPNKEVMNSLSSMYLKLIYKVNEYASLGSQIWKFLRKGNISEVTKFFNIALSSVAYDDFYKNRNEFWYRSMFVMLLRGAGIISYSEPHTSKGRADIVIHFGSNLPNKKELVIVLEFKFAENFSEIEKMKINAEIQIETKEYAKSYEAEAREIITAVMIANDEKHEVLAQVID